MAWAVSILQSKLDVDVRPYLNFPKEAATAEIRSAYIVHKWEIETLILLQLSTPKYTMQPGLNKLYDCSRFSTMGQAVNRLRSIEESEGLALQNLSELMLEIHRVGQRQFGWQRGYASSERLYRFAFIYGQGECAKYFHSEYGLTIEDYLQVSFLLFAYFQRWPWINASKLNAPKIDQTLIDKTLDLLSRPLADMRTEVETLIDRESEKRAVPIAYLPSALRRFPIIASPLHGTFISPLPELIILRATVGLYYDLRNGPQNLIAEANDRFEHYARKLIKAFCPRFDLLPSIRYGSKKASFATPDVLLKDGNQVIAVFECKATKLTYEAQFAESPIEEAEKAYSQLVKGITQLWKFFSHARRGIYQNVPIASNAHGILLTMDSWMQISDELREEASTKAKKMLEADPDISEVDMRPIIFCSIQDLSDIMFVSDEDEILKTLANAELPKYRGWGLREVRRDTGTTEKKKKFPLEIAELLPWWDRFSSPDRSAR